MVSYWIDTLVLKNWGKYLRYSAASSLPLRGKPTQAQDVAGADVKRFKQLDSQAKNIICGHLSKGQYGRVSALETAKLIWDRLSKVNEGVSTQRDSRVDVLRNLFNRFKRLNNKMSNKPSIASLTSRMSFKPSVPLISLTMK